MFTASYSSYLGDGKQIGIISAKKNHINFTEFHLCQCYLFILQ